MDNSIIQMALQKMRGQQPPDVASAGMPSAPMAQMPGLDQAYTQPMMPPQGLAPTPGMPQMPGMPGQNPFQLNQPLEAQVAGQNSQINPILKQILQQFGFLNMLRNRSNQQMVDPVMPG